MLALTSTRSRRPLAGRRYNRHVLTGSVCGNLLNQLFLSDSNIKIIQNAIRYKVYEKFQNGKLVISNQDETELVITMRAVYLEYGRNTPDDVKGQIAELNQKGIRIGRAGNHRPGLRVPTVPHRRDHPAGAHRQALQRVVLRDEDPPIRDQCLRLRHGLDERGLQQVAEARRH